MPSLYSFKTPERNYYISSKYLDDINVGDVSISDVLKNLPSVHVSRYFINGEFERINEAVQLIENFIKTIGKKGDYESESGGDTSSDATIPSNPTELNTGETRGNILESFISASKSFVNSIKDTDLKEWIKQATRSIIQQANTSQSLSGALSKSTIDKMIQNSLDVLPLFLKATSIKSGDKADCDFVIPAFCHGIFSVGESTTFQRLIPSFFSGKGVISNALANVADVGVKTAIRHGSNGLFTYLENKDSKNADMWRSLGDMMLKSSNALYSHFDRDKALNSGVGHEVLNTTFTLYNDTVERYNQNLTFLSDLVLANNNRIVETLGIIFPTPLYDIFASNGAVFRCCALKNPTVKEYGNYRKVGNGDVIPDFFEVQLSFVSLIPITLATYKGSK